MAPDAGTRKYRPATFLITGAMVRDLSAGTVHIMAAAPSAPRASPSASLATDNG